MKRIICFCLLFLIACSTSQTVSTPAPQFKPFEGPAPSGMTTTADGAIIAYDLYPTTLSKRGIILLHMLRRDRTDWTSVAKWLQEIGYTVIVPDLRGHGQSTGDWQTFTTEDYNAMIYDVASMKAVLENSGVDSNQISIIGASIGANVAFNYAATDPQIATIVLLSPGLDYRGVHILNTRYPKPFLAVSSKDDQYSAQTLEQIKTANPSAEIILYTDAGHGTNMFVHKELAPTMLSWISDHVP